MRRGYTFLELIIVVAILGILVLIAGPIFNTLQNSSQTVRATSEIVSTLRQARENSRARVSDVAYGVFFNINPTGDDSYTLYEGNSYATRNSNQDIVKTLPSPFTLSTTLVGNEINFSKGRGILDNTGTITVSQVSTGVTRVITINSLSMIDEN